MGSPGDFSYAFGIALGLLIIGLLGGAAVLSIFRWWSEGTINGGEALGLLGIFFLMFACLLGPTPPLLKLLIGILMAGSVLGLMVMPRVAARSSETHFESEKEQLYREAVASNPRNIAARVELAQNLYRQKRISEAIETMEMAVKLSPSTTANEQHSLKVWRREQDGDSNRVAICRWCREDTPSDRPECIHCGRPISAVREVADALRGDVPGMVRSFLILLPILIVGGFLFSWIANTIFGMLLMAVCVVGGLWWVWSRF